MAGTKNDTARQAIVDIAQEKGVGQYASQLCPSCFGGSTKERTLSLSVESNGVIKYHCFRASCGFSGTAYSTAAARIVAPEARAEDRLKPFTGDLHPLSKREVAFFESRYGIDPRYIEGRIYRTGDRYALPIFNPAGAKRGYITRRPFDNSPADTPAARNDPQYAVKALTYLEVDGPVQSWYRVDSDAKGVVLVEDCISAMRLVSYVPELDAVALLGTGLNAEKVREIQQVAHNVPVCIALDADATGQAFAMARKWGSAFMSCRVVVLDKDIKDMSDDEITALPL